MGSKTLRYWMTLVGGSLIILLLQACVRSEQAREILDTIDVGYVAWTDEQEPQLRLVAWEDSLVTHHTSITATCPAWSPNYDRLAYADQGKIYILNTDPMVGTIIETNFLRLSSPVWSPDGNSLAFAAQHDARLGGLDIWLLDIPTRELRLLVRCATSPGATNSCDSPTWLSDGHLSYARHVGTRANIEIFDPVSQAIESVAEKLQILPIGAPFGTERLLDNRIYSNLSWSPDGSQVAFVGGRGLFPDGAAVYVLDTATENIVQVSPSGIWADSPVWLDSTHLLFLNVVWARGAEIAYTGERSGYDAQNIVVANVNSGRLVVLSDTTPPSSESISCPFWVPRSVGERLLIP